MSSRQKSVFTTEIFYHRDRREHGGKSLQLQNLSGFSVSSVVKMDYSIHHREHREHGEKSLQLQNLSVFSVFSVVKEF